MNEFNLLKSINIINFHSQHTGKVCSSIYHKNACWTNLLTLEIYIFLFGSKLIYIILHSLHSMFWQCSCVRL